MQLVATSILALCIQQADVKLRMRTPELRMSLIVLQSVTQQLYPHAAPEACAVQN